MEIKFLSTDFWRTLISIFIKIRPVKVPCGRTERRRS